VSGMVGKDLHDRMDFQDVALERMFAFPHCFR
jgi:hypothetical protein